MKKTIIITLVAVGIIVGYLLINPVDDVKDESSAEIQDFIKLKTADLLDTSLSNELATTVVDLPDRSVSSESPTALLKNESMRQQIVSVLDISDKTERRSRLTEILINQLTPENWRGVIEAFDGQPKDGLIRDWQIFIQRAGKVVGKEAMIYFYDTQNIGDCKHCLKGWAAANPTEAIEWLDTVKLNTEGGPDIRKTLYGTAILGVARSDPSLVVELLEQLPVENRYLYANNLGKNLITHLTESIGINETERLFLAMVDRATANNELESKYMSKTFTDLAAISMTSQLMDGTIGVEEAATWLKGHMGQPYVEKNLINGTVQKLAYKDPKLAIEWLDSSFAKHPDLEVTGYTTVIDAWVEADGVNVAGEWLNDNSDHPEYDRLAFAVARNAWKKDPDSAIEWLNSMSDKKLKATLMKHYPFIK